MTSTCVGQETQLYDSFVSSNLTSSLEVKLAQIYNALARNGLLMVTRMSIQQQINHIVCGVFNIAYAYHAALENDLSCLNFDCSRMRRHLIDCFYREELLPFRMQEDQLLKRCAVKNIVIPLYCICLLPESYDKEMIQCDVCGKWYVTAAPESWTCFECI